MSGSSVLLSRDAFRSAVLDRDGHRCAICGVSEAERPLSAHHIMERRLFPDGGYYLANGVSVCDRGEPGDPLDGVGCHLKAEMTLISPQELRAAAGISDVILPPGLDDELTYTKWGDACFSDGTRTPGPLFGEEPVQKMLDAGQVHDLYRTRFKYPRTLHAVDSPNRGADGDHAHADYSTFEGREVVLLEKVDGEQCTMTRDYVHARSVDSGYHATRTWVRGLHGRIRHDIPDGWRLVGENMYGQHSIAYDHLPSYFLLFAVYDETNTTLAWDDIPAWAELLGVDVVPELWRGVFDHARVMAELTGPSAFGPQREGWVMRWTDSFSYYDHHRATAKSVRPDHVKTDQHWLSGAVAVNGLASQPK